MKKKRRKVQINNAGRYFGSAMIDGGENQTVSFDKNGGQDTDIFYNEGRFTDYIGLDASDTDDEDMKTEGLIDSFPDRVCDDFLDLQSNDIDSLIKPIRLMNKNPI
ncbi:hypothetical protein QJS10_CPB13g01721 [Acorus calamus]|nr:hypothetical protein QJS10_CPB13g01721 [Acorus calamus]